MEYKFYDEDEPRQVPHKNVVCGRCQGEGVHDCWEGGMSGDEMAEQGPEFFEDYMSGMYDRACSECNGRRVVQVVDRKRVPKALLDRIDDQEREDAEYQAMVDAERRHFGY